ncbi:hypothetical protein ABVK25_008546 [Lepraria finkii]|uniref:Uncharacterized protein n=1 Tax=Lepraria finkii TaxID=1340010 RepID=A0ABR4AZN9_9LECA
MTPPVIPDPYISNRFSPQEVSESFRLSKPSHQLFSSERLLRHPSPTPDPFGPLIVQQRREARDTLAATSHNQEREYQLNWSEMKGAVPRAMYPLEPWRVDSGGSQSPAKKLRKTESRAVSTIPFR